MRKERMERTRETGKEAKYVKAREGGIGSSYEIRAGKGIMEAGY